MTPDAAGLPRFTVGGVIAASLSVVFAHFFRFLAIILAVGGPVGVLIVGGGLLLAQDPAVTVTGLNIKVENPNTVQTLFVIASAILGGLAYSLILSALTYGTLQALRGRAAGFGESLSAGLAALPRMILTFLVLLFIIALVGGVAMLFMSMFLGAFGAGMVIISLAVAAATFYVLSLIWVFIPAIVAERAGALDSLSRSMVLTQGHRWGIVGLIILITIANWIVAFLNQMLTQVAPVAGTVIDVAINAFFISFGAILAAVGYSALRAEKEGVPVDDLMKVFD